MYKDPVIQLVYLGLSKFCGGGEAEGMYGQKGEAKP